MSSGNNSLPAAVIAATEQDLRPLASDSADELDLDDSQAEAMEESLRAAWFFGLETGQKVMLGSSEGTAGARAVVSGVEHEFQELMERLAEKLDTTVGATLAAWDYLGRAWIAGARFWEVEIAARLIEHEAGGPDEVLRRLPD